MRPRPSPHRPGLALVAFLALHAGPACRTDVLALDEKGFRTTASFSLVSTCGREDGACRRKRSHDDHEEESDFVLRLSLDEAAPGLHDNVLSVRLKRSSPSVGQDHFRLVVRDETGVSVNRSVAFPKCVFAGRSHEHKVDVAVSHCHRNRLKGILETPNGSLIVEELPGSATSRVKRDSDLASEADPDLEGHVVVYESAASLGACGLKPTNLQRMRAPPVSAVSLVPAVKLELDGTDSDSDLESTRPGRERREAPDAGSSKTKAIELAVFVDDDLFRRESAADDASGDGDPVQDIQDIVFTYLNSVQILYSSRRLDTNFRLVLVRLEIFKSAISGIDKAKGDIEHYLDSFCGWQKEENPGDDSTDDHWDHAMLLTGLDLFDGTPKMDSVIGLAWVSGMCHPAYSCSISEGSNFESVYVISHEMGHNLGMNHDGDARERNGCDPDKFLMSPVLGPGKVTWSTCSNAELENFLQAPLTRAQTQCLDDVPTPSAKYDFLREKLSPGEKFTALQQCQKAFGSKFVPHVKSEPPFEDLCRELWCANSTHALRAHPALEGTDCSSKPYPYGSVCKAGVCSPFDPTKPDGEEAVEAAPPSGTAVNEVTSNNIDTSHGHAKPKRVDPNRPEWYDPIFTRIFSELRTEYSKRYPSENGRTLMLPLEKGKLLDDKTDAATWLPINGECPVDCGGGWTNVTFACSVAGKTALATSCDTLQKPRKSRTTCNITPCP